jgi:hypothetical protein
MLNADERSDGDVQAKPSEAGAMARTFSAMFTLSLQTDILS